MSLIKEVKFIFLSFSLHVHCGFFERTGRHAFFKKNSLKCINSLACTFQAWKYLWDDFEKKLSKANIFLLSPNSQNRNLSLHISVSTAYEEASWGEKGNKWELNLAN